MNTPPGLAVMYHYVRPRNEPCPAGIRPLWADEFEQQLDWLAERFEILDSDRLAGTLAGTYHPGRPWCVLTFDDGTKDHATIATPILRRRGLAGFFFLLTGPWLDQRLPTAHRVHVLLSRVATEVLWQAILDAVSIEFGPDSVGKASEAQRIYDYEDSLDRMRIKYALNFALPEPFVDRLTRQLISQLVGDEAQLAQDWFVTPAEARVMAVAGMVLGTHGRNHLAIGRLSPDAAEAKIRNCHATLTEALGVSPRWYAYPFGGAGASEATLDRADIVLQELGYHSVFIYGVNRDPWLNVVGAGFSRLDRFDCIRFPPRGQGPSENLDAGDRQS
jgi:peptidoglycan/xylan/chitin deacetylase (PgdA/CDA1 family)